VIVPHAHGLVEGAAAKLARRAGAQHDDCVRVTDQLLRGPPCLECDKQEQEGGATSMFQTNTQLS
jgi:hypothetical protein